jgi:hypothetical protein
MNEDDYLNRVRLAWRTLGIPAIRKGDSTKVTIPNAFSPVYIRPGEVYTIPRELQKAAPKAFPQSDYPWNRERNETLRRQTVQATEVWNEPRFVPPQPIDWTLNLANAITAGDIQFDNTTLRVDTNTHPTLTLPVGWRAAGGGGGTGGVDLAAGTTFTTGLLNGDFRMDLRHPTDIAEQTRQRNIEAARWASIGASITPPHHFGFNGTETFRVQSGTYVGHTVRAPIERDTPDVRIGNDLEAYRRDLEDAMLARFGMVDSDFERPAITQRASVRQDRPFYRQGRRF